MSQFQVSTDDFSRLRGKVVVLTGGAGGIGAATTSLLYSAGAHVFFGDIDQTLGSQLSSQLAASDDANVIGGTATFVQCDITRYDDIYALFRRAWDTHGRIDHAIANAGILEQGNWFDPELTVDSVGARSETTKVIDVNVVGTATFSRVAAVFLREGKKKGTVSDASLAIVGSVASLRESPGLPMYQMSKHAVLGLMRALRKPLYERDHIRVNCVCPGFTKSAMTEKIFHVFQEKGLATQVSMDVARIIAGTLTAEDLQGEAVYVEAGKGWKFEHGVWDHMDAWLGEEPTRALKANAEFVSSGGLVAAIGK